MPRFPHRLGRVSYLIDQVINQSCRVRLGCDCCRVLRLKEDE
jgi:hypothetical protein